jgi:hypothetical protein
MLVLQRVVREVQVVEGRRLAVGVGRPGVRDPELQAQPVAHHVAEAHPGGEAGLGPFGVVGVGDELRGAERGAERGASGRRARIRLGGFLRVCDRAGKEKPQRCNAHREKARDHSLVTPWSVERKVREARCNERGSIETDPGGVKNRRRACVRWHKHFRDRRGRRGGLVSNSRGGPGVATWTPATNRQRASGAPPRHRNDFAPPGVWNGPCPACGHRDPQPLPTSSPHPVPTTH